MFYCFLDRYSPIKENYLKSLIASSKKMHKTIKECKKLGIVPRAQKQPDAQIARHSTMKDNFDNFQIL